MWTFLKLIPFKSQIIIALLGLLLSTGTYFKGRIDEHKAIDRATASAIIQQVKQQQVVDNKAIEGLNVKLTTAQSKAVNLERQLSEEPRDTHIIDDRVVRVLNDSAVLPQAAPATTAAQSAPQPVDTSDLEQDDLACRSSYSSLSITHDALVDWELGQK